MGRRALVAYRRGGRFRVHRAQWGTGLAGRVRPDRPFGGAVDPRPVRRRATAAGVLDALDPGDDSLVVVEPGFAARSYLVRSLAFPALTDGEVADDDLAAGTGARRDDSGEAPPDAQTPTGDLVLFEPRGEADQAREWLAVLRSRLDAAVARGGLSPGTAGRTLRAALDARGEVHPADDASLLVGGR